MYHRPFGESVNDLRIFYRKTELKYSDMPLLIRKTSDDARRVWARRRKSLVSMWRWLRQRQLGSRAGTCHGTQQARNVWLMVIELVFETHSTTVDNEQGRATGWLPGQLSDQGRANARQLGLRRRNDGIAAVFSSDLARAAQTVAIAFADSPIPILYDWRLRECDYGQRNGMPAAELHASRRDHLDRPYPGGESWRQAVARVNRFLADLSLRWTGRRILVVGHVATRWGLDHYLGGKALEHLADQDFAWQEGWEYRLG
jgi:broad specificity phosphatase PhoE